MLASAAIDLQQLQFELQSARGAFDKWASNSVTAADQLRDSHRQNIAQLQGDLESLKERHQELTVQAESLKQRLSVEHSQEAALQAELSLVQAEEAALPLKISKLQEALQLEHADLQRREEIIRQEEATRQKSLGSLRRDLDIFRKRLGLTFQGISGDNLSFVFTQIDPEDHARRFVFGVKVQEGKKYAVTACEPPVKGLDSLVQSLNQGSLQFSTFVQSMRRQFQHLC